MDEGRVADLYGRGEIIQLLWASFYGTRGNIYFLYKYIREGAKEKNWLLSGHVAKRGGGLLRKVDFFIQNVKNIQLHWIIFFLLKPFFSNVIFLVTLFKIVYFRAFRFDWYMYKKRQNIFICPLSVMSELLIIYQTISTLEYTGSGS